MNHEYSQEKYSSEECKERVRIKRNLRKNGIKLACINDMKTKDLQTLINNMETKVFQALERKILGKEE